jgi:hypothetical protein
MDTSADTGQQNHKNGRHRLERSGGQVPFGFHDSWVAEDEL